jgi:hypothetical protein
MPGPQNLSPGVTREKVPLLGPTVELCGNVQLVKGYALTNFVGCHAVVKLLDGSTVIVLTSEQRLQSLLETALATGFVICFQGQLFQNPPPSPDGGTWEADLYVITDVTLYSGKKLV